MSLLERWHEWRTSRAEQRAVVVEMEFHVEQETAHNIRRGMSPAEARRAARKSFGGVDRFAEEARDERPGTRLSEFAVSWLDWKLGARMLVKYPGLSVIGGLTLAAAIGLGAGVFDVTMLLLHPDLPLPEGDRIVRIENVDAESSAVEARAGYDYDIWREQVASIEDLGAYRTVEHNLITADGVTRAVQVAEMSASGFTLARVAPLLGRAFTEEEERSGAAHVVLIGHDLWQRRFGGDRGILGRDVQLGRTKAAIIGVMPEGFGFPISHEAWTPLRAPRAAPREGLGLGIFGRLAEGATLESAQAELSGIGGRLAVAHPSTHAHLRPRVLPYAAPESSGVVREMMLIHLGAWLLLVAACVNVAALLFARTAMRESEIIVRNALGASRMRVMGQLFTEALVLTSAAAVAGLAAASLLIRYVLRTQFGPPSALPFWVEARIEPVTILYTALLAVVGAALTGLLPAIRATGKRVQAGLARVGSGGTSLRFGGVWSTIIVLQVAFSVLCLPFAIAGAMESMRDRRVLDAFPSDAYLTFRPALDPAASRRTLAPPDSGAGARLADVIDRLALRLEDEPGVAGVTVVGRMPPGAYQRMWRIEVQRGTEPPARVETWIEGGRAGVASVGIAFFDTFDRPITAGRAFHRTDVGAPTPVVIVNESLAQNIGGNPIGERIREASGPDGQPGAWHEIVGVVRNLGLNPTDEGEADGLFLPASAAQAPWVAVRVNGDAVSFVPRLSGIATQLEPDLRLHDVRPLREVIRRHHRPVVQLTLLGIGVVLLAIILSAASLYALMSVAVALRTREIGIRVAIGASPTAVLTALFRRAATQVGIGVVGGNVLALIVLSIIIEDVRAAVVIPPMAIGSVVMALVGLIACFVPGRRALRIQPTQALKEAR